MGYHYAHIEAEHRWQGEKQFFTVVTAWSEWDMKRLNPSEAYTLASEDHKILRWFESNNIIPGDIIEAAGWPYAAEMDAARSAELSAFMTEYRKARANRTPEQRAEELFELRANFEPGTTVVNVLTGERTKV